VILLIGSSAAQLHMDTRDPVDTDLIMEMGDLLDFVERNNVEAAPVSKTRFVGHWAGDIVEMEVAWPGSSAAELLDIVRGDIIEVMGQKLFLPTLDWLYTIKMSHRFLKNSPHFLKTMQDIYAMRKAGAKIADREWLALREAETYTKARPNLNVTSETFFSEGSQRFTYDHDSVHRAMATMTEGPAYLRYKSDDKEVWCDQEKWKATPEYIKRYGVVEECYVLAIERSLVPFPGKLSPQEAFIMALEKVCTSITSGWFREYAWEHYDDILETASPRYFDIFKDKVAKGTVQLSSETQPSVTQEAVPA